AGRARDPGRGPAHRARRPRAFQRPAGRAAREPGLPAARLRDLAARDAGRRPSDRTLDPGDELMRALFTAATGMSAQQTRLDAISNNLANVNTTGYKKSRAEFQDLFYETLRAPGALAANGAALPSGVQIGNGVKLAAIGKQMGQGEFVSTGRDLDLAVEG